MVISNGYEDKTQENKIIIKIKAHHTLPKTPGTSQSPSVSDLPVPRTEVPRGQEHQALGRGFWFSVQQHRHGRDSPLSRSLGDASVDRYREGMGC